MRSSFPQAGRSEAEGEVYERIVECKRKKVIDKDVIQEVDRKVKRIARPDGVSIRTALVYDGELSAFVETNGYFDALVPLKSVMGL